MAKASKKNAKVPNLRFPGFEGEWKIKEIGKILKIGSGRDYKHLSNGDIPVFGTGGYMTSVNKHLYDGESVCIGRKGTINKPFYFNGKFWTVDTLFYTRSYENSLPKYILYVFENINWLKYNEASGVPSLSKSTIEQIEIFLPNISEQQKIANFLTLIDERIATQNKIIEELELLKSTLSKKLFSRQLKFKNDNDFPNWEVKKLKDVVNVKMGQSPDSSSYNINGIGVPLIQGNADITDRKSNPRQYTSNPIKLCEVGDILLTVRAPVGYVAKSLHNACIGRGMCSIKSNEYSLIEFIYQFLLQFENNWKSIEQGSTFTSVNFSDIGLISIKVPSIKEQTQIANLLSSIDTKIDIDKDQLQKLEKQKKYFLENLFI